MPRLPVACLALAVLAAAPLAGQAPECASTATGDLRLHTLHSEMFRNTRTIRVLVPPGYDDPANAERRYPVLYLLDGQNVFDACLSDVSRREWEADETVHRLINEGTIPPMIVVGIDHAGRQRGHEYLPFRDHVYSPDMPEPAGDRFPRFVAREVMPLVNGAYRTHTGRDHTAIGGSSYGGVAALYAILARPNDFGRALIESPSLHVGMGELVRLTDPLAAFPARVFIAFGGRESSNPAMSDRLIAFVRQVEANFRAAGYDDGTLRVVIEPEGRHSEPDWARRLPGALTFLFGEAP